MTPEHEALAKPSLWAKEYLLVTILAVAVYVTPARVRDPLRKMHLKRLNTGPGGIGPRLFGDQVASTVQTNGDLETS